MNSVSDVQIACRYNKGVNCMWYHVHVAKGTGEEYPECAKCGWNPGISAERLFKLRQKMRGETENA